MVIDIIKFFFIYALVLFAFACGLNQLLWYYADMEKQQCFSGTTDGTENWTQQRDSCLAWRRFSNLFESSQTLFWASFGLVDLSNFELTGIKSYTRFWGLLMFGSYSVINVVVLLNLLIAMMSNSYNIISERADVEWKFARTTLFMNYFEEGNTVPPPFNIFPTLKHLLRLFVKQNSFKDMSIRRKQTKIKERDSIYQGVMCNLVWRYVTAQQKETESHPVTEDNINELRQDVYTFRHDLMRVLKSSGMNTRDIEKDQVDVTGKRVQIRKRRLIKDFSIGLMEVCTDEAAPEITSNKGVLARLVGLSGTETRSSQRWRDLIQAAKKSKIIGNRDSDSGRFGSIRRQRSEEESIENQMQDKINLEFQKSGQAETDQPSGNKLYPNIPEEDLAQATERSAPPALIQTTAGKTLSSPVIRKMETSSPKPSLKDSLQKGIKLSPQGLMKQIPKKEKYPAPKPVVSDNTAPSRSTIGISTNVNTKSSDSLQLSIPNIYPKIDADTSNSYVDTKCKDTTITVTSSPEKASAPKDNSMTSVEICSGEITPDLIDIKENQDSSAIINISVITNSNQDENNAMTQQFSETNESGEGSISVVTPEYVQSPQRSMDQSRNSKEDQMVNIDGSHVITQPPTFERQGWL